MSDLLSIGLSGLRTSRNNITVTGHNISNIDTPGFSRQRAVQVTNSAMSTGAGYMGSGGRTQTIERIVDQYTINQVRVDTSSLKDNQAYLRNAGELDNLLSNENSALGTAMNGFFEGMQSAANDPLSKPARQLVFSQVDSVSQRFKTAHARLADQGINLNTQVRTYTSKINEISMGVGQLNKQVAMYAGKNSQPPNDLLDKRDELLRQLSEIVDVQVQVQDGMSVNVSIGNGVPLVFGESVNRLEVTAGSNDKGRSDVFMMDKHGGEMKVTNEMTGGEMGGIIRYRSDTLDPALNEMGRIAIIFAGEANNQHHAGTDLDGNQGGDIFRDINTKEFQLDRIPGIERIAPAGVWLDPNGLNKLPTNEFLLTEQDGNLVLKDSVTGQDMLPNASYPDIETLNEALQEKFGFKLSNGDTPPDYLNPPPPLNRETPGVDDLIKGGGLLISPVYLGASQLERSTEKFNNINKIALGGIAGDENNKGTAKLGYIDINLTGNAGESISLKQAGLSGYQIKATTSADLSAKPPTYGEFSLLDNVGKVVIPGPITPSADGQLKIDNIPGVTGSLELSISKNELKDGDFWILEGTAGGQNGKNLSFLQQENLVGRGEDGIGGSSLSETYSMLVEDVGIRTSESRTATDVSLATLNQSVSMRESASGVNMDEEAGNLIRFQQAYMASSQVISTAQKLFDTLIASVGR